MPSKKGERPLKNERPIRYAIYAIFLFLIISLAFTIHLYSEGLISQTSYLVYASIAQSMVFSFVVFAYMLATGRNLRQIIRQLGLSGKSFGSKYLLYGFGIFLAIFALEIILSIFQAVTGIQLPTNVAQLFNGLPFYFLVFSVVVVPVNEEILFRGFLVPKLGAALAASNPNAKRRRNAQRSALWFGIIMSALIFAALHYLSYASISELVAALVFGLIAGYVRMRKDSLYPSIFAHMLINFIGLLALAILALIL